MIPFADLKRQYQNHKTEIDACIHKSLENTAFIGGNGILEFEKSFSEYLSVENCVACANGTDSIEILLKAMGIKEGDEVLVPAISWISTSEAVSSLGASPVFVDIDPNTYTIDVQLIQSKITPKTKTIIPVHLYGQPANMKAIMEIARKFDLKVLEDCAQAHGAKIENQLVGSFGDAASFSFYPGKNLGAYGDAGCMVSNSNEIAKAARRIANHGQDGKHNHIIEGRNSRLDAMQAAILNVKLPYLNGWITRRNEIGKKYLREITNSKILMPTISDNEFHAFHLFVIRSDERDELRAYLRDHEIGTSIHYPKALPFLECYKSFNHTEMDFPVAAKYQSKILSIPMFPELTEDEIIKVIEVLNGF
jgi:dTDP-4-amino-4,6-dideoxygalactose transaminase